MVSRKLERLSTLVVLLTWVYPWDSSLPGDPDTGEKAGELDSFIQFLITRLLNSLKGKALNYTKDRQANSRAKCHLFMVNNSYYLRLQLAPSANDEEVRGGDHRHVIGPWLVEKANDIIASEKAMYLRHWESLNNHFSALDSADLNFKRNDGRVLTLKSGRLIKQRFADFNEAYERTYEGHKKLCSIHPSLRLSLQQDVEAAFLPRYRVFYDKYAQVQFSKKHQAEYTRYSPDQIKDMLGNLFDCPG